MLTSNADSMTITPMDADRISTMIQSNYER
jgi:hypothetical protein